MVLFGGPQGPGKGNAAAPNGFVGSEILGAGQLLIAGMRETTGSGDPEQGDVFGQAALRFGGAEEAVTAALPGDAWKGGAARAYAERNRRQADRAASMAVLDRGVHTVIAREAQQVVLHRENLESQANHLANVRRTTESIARIPGVGEALKAAFELTAVNAALTTGATELQQLTQEVDENAAALQQIADEYAVVADRAVSAPLGDEMPPADPTQAADLPHDTAAEAPPESDVQPTMPPEAMSAIGSALGVVGGAIGAVVAPMAAALSGVAGAAGQSLGMLSSVGATDELAQTPSLGEEPDRRDRDAESRETESEAAPSGRETPDTEPSGGGPAAESEAHELDQPVKLDPGDSPAATRPPQF